MGQLPKAKKRLEGRIRNRQCRLHKLNSCLEGLGSVKRVKQPLSGAVSVSKRTPESSLDSILSSANHFFLNLGFLSKIGIVRPILNGL